jgi:hypothetical protein
VGTKAAWTPERRARQSDLIRCVRPWSRSTGPRTAAGKARSSRNATAFLKDEEAGHGYRLVSDFLESGQLTPALAELLYPGPGDQSEPPDWDDLIWY